SSRPAQAGIEYAVTIVGIEPAAFTGSSAFADDDGCICGAALPTSRQSLGPRRHCNFSGASYDDDHSTMPQPA
ncbi:MAG: hypothetical protein WBE32_09480, partial [Pseudolabrys sp.]